MIHAESPRLAEERVVSPQCGSQGPSTVAGSRLNKNLLEGGLANNAAVGHAVQTYPTSDTQILHARGLLEIPRHAEHQFFGDLLNAGGDVGVMLVQLRNFVDVGRRFSEVLRKS